MVNSISGKLTFKNSETAGIQTGGVEWALEMSGLSLSALPPLGSELKILTYLHHTKDALKMFGFISEEERRVFFALLTVDGVGPSLARRILSGISPERFVSTVDAEDVSSLTSVPGLGKKTAQKIILHLRGKLVEAGEKESDMGGEDRDVIEALVSMGFETRGAARIVGRICSNPDIKSMDDAGEREKEILRRAIVELSS